MRHLIIITSILVLVGGGFVSHADARAPTPGQPATREEQDEVMKAIFGDSKERVRVMEENLKKTPEGREMLKRKEEFMKVVAEAQKKETERQKRIATEKTKLTERLSTVRDEKKRQILLHVQEQIQSLSDRMVFHFEAVLSQIRGLLARIEMMGRPTDTAEAQELIEKAKVAITVAADAIAVQQQKVYSVSFTGEKLKDGAKATRETLHTDLKTVREKIVAAKEAVRAVAKVAPIPIPEPPQLPSDSNPELIP